MFISCTSARRDKESQSDLCTRSSSHWLWEKHFTQEAWVKCVHESAECIKISLRALISKAKATTLLMFKWAKWQEPGHHWSQEYLWHSPAVQVFQSLSLPMLDLSINTPSTATPGLSIIFCQRCCSSPWESIQSTSLPLLTPDNCKNVREFAVLGSSWITSLLVYYNSVQEKLQALYTSTCTGSWTENSQLLESTSLSLNSFRHSGRGSQTSPHCTTNFFPTQEEQIHTSCSSHPHQQKGCCWGRSS